MYGFGTIITHGRTMLTIYLSYALLSWTLWQRNSPKMMKSFAQLLISFQPEQYFLPYSREPIS